MKYKEIQEEVEKLEIKEDLIKFLKIKQLDKARENCNLPKKDVAESLDVSPVTYSNWLSVPDKSQVGEIENLIPKLKDVSKIFD